MILWAVHLTLGYTYAMHIIVRLRTGALHKGCQKLNKFSFLFALIVGCALDSKMKKLNIQLTVIVTVVLGVGGRQIQVF